MCLSVHVNILESSQIIDQDPGYHKAIWFSVPVCRCKMAESLWLESPELGNMCPDYH